MGPSVPPDVLVPRELPGGPHPRLHRPLLATGRRGPRPVLGARHHAAPGLRRGPDRRRQRPEPVRDAPDRGEGRTGHARPDGHPTGAAPAGLERPVGRLARPRGAGDRRPERGRRARPRRRARLPAPTTAIETVPAEVALAFHPRTLGQLLFVRSSLKLDDVTDRFLAAAITGILHGKSASYLSELMPNTFSMAPRYVRDFAARTAFASPDRDVFDGAVQEARPTLPPAATADHRDRPARRRP